EIIDPDALSRALTGARGVYARIPTDMTGPDFRAYQDRVTESIAKALEKGGVTHAVTLSSVGADKPEKTGPVVGLRKMDIRLAQVCGLNALHLRAGYFMENTLAQIGIIRSFGIMAGPVRAHLPVSMIATRDIGAAAAEGLVLLD